MSAGSKLALNRVEKLLSGFRGLDLFRNKVAEFAQIMSVARCPFHQDAGDRTDVTRKTQRNFVENFWLMHRRADCRGRIGRTGRDRLQDSQKAERR